MTEGDQGKNFDQLQMDETTPSQGVVYTLGDVNQLVQAQDKMFKAMSAAIASSITSLGETMQSALAESLSKTNVPKSTNVEKAPNSTNVEKLPSPLMWRISESPPMWKMTVYHPQM